MDIQEVPESVIAFQWRQPYRGLVEDAVSLYGSLGRLLVSRNHVMSYFLGRVTRRAGRLGVERAEREGSPRSGVGISCVDEISALALESLEILK